MVEVFKTNIKDPHLAKLIIDQIHKRFAEYKTNFDLNDCDNILRIESESGIQSPSLIYFLQIFGCEAEILPDDDQVIYNEFEELKESKT